jgi:uncharacterized protein with FMN-binding domain
MRSSNEDSKKTGAAKRALATLCIAMPLSLCGCFVDDIKSLVIADVKPEAVKDGTYEGAQYDRPITAKVRVAVRGGKIDSIDILEHGHGPGRGAEAIVDRVIGSQSLRVDSVSGATLSSQVMLKAIERALDLGL